MCAGPPGARGDAPPRPRLAGCGLGASARSRACTQYGLRLYRVLFRPPEQCVLSKLECAWKLNQRDPRCGVWIVGGARCSFSSSPYLLVTRGPGWGTVPWTWWPRGAVPGVRAASWCIMWCMAAAPGGAPGTGPAHRAPARRPHPARAAAARVCVCASIVYEVWRVRARRGRKKTRAGDDSTRTVTKSDTTANEDSVATTQACAMRLPTVHTTLAYFYVSLGVRLWTDATRLPQLVSSDVSALTVPRRVRARRRLGGLRRHPRGM
jgi:hypothetical protein